MHYRLGSRSGIPWACVVHGVVVAPVAVGGCSSSREPRLIGGDDCHEAHLSAPVVVDTTCVRVDESMQADHRRTTWIYRVRLRVDRVVKGTYERSKLEFSHRQDEMVPPPGVMYSVVRAPVPWEVGKRYRCYFSPDRDGSPRRLQVAVLEEAMKFLPSPPPPTIQAGGG